MLKSHNCVLVHVCLCVYTVCVRISVCILCVYVYLCVLCVVCVHVCVHGINKNPNHLKKCIPYNGWFSLGAGHSE